MALDEAMIERGEGLEMRLPLGEFEIGRGRTLRSEESDAVIAGTNVLYQAKAVADLEVFEESTLKV
jgi:hypothetical protein